ncbi:MAG: hypothetical protein JSR17_13505 [Proteobacteria bacterium]|nr:hypothetical protein [Pseudomonadota bacterium]
MSFGGPQHIDQQLDLIIRKYPHKQLTKFIQLASAEINKDEATVSALMDSFVDDEENNCGLFIADIAALESSNVSQVQLLLQLNKKLIEKTDSDISTAKQKRGAITTQYEDRLGAAAGSFRTQPKDSSSAPSSTTHNSDKKRGGCTIC